MRSDSQVHFDDPFKARHDFSHATAFLIVMALLVGVGAIIFSGTSWIFRSDLVASDIPVVSPAPTTLASTKPTVVAAANSGATPAATGPVPTAVSAQMPGGSLTQPSPTAAPQAPAQAAILVATVVPVATPAATALAGRLKVANTGGDGVFLRRSPSMGDRLTAWPENTVMEDLGEQVTGDGQTWRKVKDPRGQIGYIPVQYLGNGG